MRVEVEVKMTPLAIATAFCEMCDEDQAQFFIEAAKIAETWENPQSHQWYLVGRHLRTCSCSTDEARDMVSSIASAVEYHEQ